MAYLNGIDISHWQKGLNVNAVPHDFIIAKATQGTSSVDECCSGFVETERSRGGLFGTYHYISGGNANGEAEHYIRSISNWVGEGILCLDWEKNQNSAWGNVGYLEAVTKRVIELTGIPPVLYGSKSVYNQLKQVADKYNCGLWIAQYPDYNATGYQETPWNEGAYGCAIRQYTSSGRLSGYSGNLDLDKFYGDAATWKRYANPTGSSAPTVSVPSSGATGGSEVVPVHYALRLKNGKWLSEVTNFNNSDSNGFAGCPCKAHDLVYAYADRGTLRYRVHTIEDKKWLPWVRKADPNDTINGCAGIANHTIDGFQAYYETPGGETFKQAWYRSQTTKKKGWLGVCCDDGTTYKKYDSWAGILKQPLDRLQISISNVCPF